jgi:carbonic anhydrase/acetyltransferase-like protein (isoleucine patch superfamily)
MMQGGVLMLRRAVVTILVPVYLILIGGLPLVAVALLMRSASAAGGWALVAAVLVAPSLYVVLYILVAGALARLTIRAIVQGRFPRDLGHPVYGPRRLYGLCWTAIYYCGPVYHALLAVPLLKRVGLRLFGYRGSLRFITYPDTWLRDLPLLDVADGVYLSNKATIGTNVCLRSGDIIVGPIRIGPRSLVGHLAIIGPGAVLEEDVEVGISAAIGIQVRIGAQTRVGPAAAVNHKSTVGANCTIGTGAQIGKGAVIGDGVTIPPGFIVPDGATVHGPADVQGLELVHRRSIAGVAAVMPGLRSFDAEPA